MSLHVRFYIAYVCVPTQICCIWIERTKLSNKFSAGGGHWFCCFCTCSFVPISLRSHPIHVMSLCEMSVCSIIRFCFIYVHVATCRSYAVCFVLLKFGMVAAYRFLFSLSFSFFIYFWRLLIFLSISHAGLNLLLFFYSSSTLFFGFLPLVLGESK